jgi:tRNA (mo5U34)-methyltransferase
MSEQEQETKSLTERIAAVPYWYHKIDLPMSDGGVVTTPGWAPIHAESYGIPEDLTGKRVLDIGAWDGYWTWEALKRGAAEVVAIDDLSDACGREGGRDQARDGWAGFHLCREALGFAAPHYECRDDMTRAVDGWTNGKGQTVRIGTLSVYEIAGLGNFDVVFAFGVLYHLKHPLLALERIADVCTGELYIESAIADDYTPYKHGLVQGLRDREMTMEFYPTDEYGQNPSNWWVPTLKCLAYMVQTAGFESVELWRLTNNPAGVAQCRGFLWAGKDKQPTIATDGATTVVSADASPVPPPNVLNRRQTAEVIGAGPKLAAVMSVPRLGFEDNSSAILETLRPLHVPLLKVWGAFWGQCLERGIQTQIDAGADLILTIDNDSLFVKEDLQELLALIQAHPEVDALVPLQVGRDGKGPLATMRTKTGQRQTEIPGETFKPDLAPIATGNFGLTLIRVSALLKMPHPWFLAQPDREGQWGRDRVDADINFWRQFRAYGNNAYLANRVAIGHLEAVVAWPSDKQMQPIYQPLPQWRKEGKPKNAWQ